MDYFHQSITGIDSLDCVRDTWQTIYPGARQPRAWMGLNLLWPKFDLPLGHGLYLVSWHTEYMDVDWLIRQCQKVHPAKVIVITDWPCNFEVFEIDNLICLVYDSLGQQIDQIRTKFGLAEDIRQPRFKLSSQSMRFSQFKKFVTAYIITRFDHADIILSWHNWLGKTQDLHGHPPGYPHLDLDYTVLNRKILINLSDENDSINISPVDNGNWRSTAYVDALINLTNESFHYSFTHHFGLDWQYPGPYLTEKTMKPLLAGRPFMVVGQCQTYQRLVRLGFNVDFGLDIVYDEIPGDLDRINGVFQSLDKIHQASISELFDCSRAACWHNLQHIKTGDLLERSRQINQATISAINHL